MLNVLKRKYIYIIGIFPPGAFMYYQIPTNCTLFVTVILRLGNVNATSQHTREGRREAGQDFRR